MSRFAWLWCSIGALSLIGCQRVEPPGMCETALVEQIDSQRMLEHLGALQTIADAHDGTRAAGTPGYDASVDYVAQILDDAGYVVEREPFEFDRFVEDEPSLLEQLAPEPVAYEYGTDYVTAEFSGAADATQAIQAIDLALGPANASTSGCEAEDFDAMVPGRIALVQRGTCTFATKAGLAEAAGASAVLIFNQGDTDDRMEVFGGTLGAGSHIEIPVLLTSYPVGEALAALAGTATVHVAVDGRRETQQADNLVAHTPDGNAGEVVMLGAHLDSVPAGPGINDNGSGSAVLLQLAERTIECAPKRQVRFGWWGAEELGLIGSTEHVSSLTAPQLRALIAYLNFDMVASPNFVHSVYDGDGSSTGIQAPPGSGTIEELLRDHFAADGIEPSSAPLNGRSDYLAFMNEGIPVGGTFTGAEGSKSNEEADTFGGAPQTAYDPCYHQACDTIDNISIEALEQNAEAAASVLDRLASDPDLLDR